MKFENLLFKINGVRISKNVSFKNLTTMAVGGRCLYVAEPNCLDALNQVILLSKECQIPFKILGCGSNVIACDDDFFGVVIKLGRFFQDISCQKNTVSAYSGAKLNLLSKYTEVYSLSGGEFLSCIPGTVGGGVITNAGCFGGECSKVISRVFLTNGRDTFDLSPVELGFGYRKCNLSLSDNVIYKVEFKFKQANYDVSERIKRMLDAKRKTQPLNKKSAGSIFKRQGDFLPAKCIDELGLKGLSVNGASVSTLHAGFIVNLCQATQKDIIRLIDIIKQKVFNATGRILELEVELMKSL